jgi:hypothetical protein
MFYCETRLLSSASSAVVEGSHTWKTNSFRPASGTLLYLASVAWHMFVLMPQRKTIWRNSMDGNSTQQSTRGNGRYQSYNGFEAANYLMLISIIA